MATEQHSQPSDTDLIATLLEDRPVTYKPIVAKALKHTDVARKMRHVTAATVFLSNVMYWSSKKESKQVGGWAYRKAYQIEEETGLSRFEQEKARLLLVEAGVMEEATRGVPPIKHYRVLYDGLLPLLRQQLAREMGSDETEDQEEKIPANPNLLDSLSNKNETHNSQINSGDSLSNKNETQARKSYTDKASKEANKEVDNQSIDPPAHATPAREGSSSNDEAGQTDRQTDRQTDQGPKCQTSGFSAPVQLLEPEDSHRDEGQATDLSPKEDEDNAPTKPEEALRQEVGAIPTSEISEEARQLTGELLQELPALSERDQLRIARLAEHYQRLRRTRVFKIAASGVALYATQQRVRQPFSYLLACCVDAESERSEGDEDLLDSLSGENTSSSSEESQPSGYERFFSEREQESKAGENQQRQHTPDPDPEALEVWERVLDDAAEETGSFSMRVWFEGSVAVSLSGETLTVSVPNGTAKEYIEDRFGGALQEQLAKHLSPTASLELVLDPEGATDNTNKWDATGEEDG